jgi:hypothetical protein
MSGQSPGAANLTPSPEGVQFQQKVLPNRNIFSVTSEFLFCIFEKLGKNPVCSATQTFRSLISHLRVTQQQRRQQGGAPLPVCVTRPDMSGALPEPVRAALASFEPEAATCGVDRALLEELHHLPCEVVLAALESYKVALTASGGKPPAASFFCPLCAASCTVAPSGGGAGGDASGVTLASVVEHLAAHMYHFELGGAAASGHRRQGGGGGGLRSLFSVSPSTVGRYFGLRCDRFLHRSCASRRPQSGVREIMAKLIAEAEAKSRSRTAGFLAHDVPQGREVREVQLARLGAGELQRQAQRLGITDDHIASAQMELDPLGKKLSTRTTRELSLQTGLFEKGYAWEAELLSVLQTVGLPVRAFALSVLLGFNWVTSASHADPRVRVFAALRCACVHAYSHAGGRAAAWIQPRLRQCAPSGPS